MVANVAGTSKVDLVDRLLGGRLWELLEGWQDEGLSLYEISIKLRDEHDIRVTPGTIARWLKARQPEGGDPRRGAA